MWKWIKYPLAMVLVAWVATGIGVVGDRFWLEVLIGAAAGAGMVYAFDRIGRKS